MSARDLMHAAEWRLNQGTSPGDIGAAQVSATLAVAEALIEHTEADEHRNGAGVDIGWAQVELMGRHIEYGHVAEVSIAGRRFLRVDVPEVREDAKATVHYYSPGAIYGIHPTDEPAVRAAIARGLPFRRCDSEFDNPHLGAPDRCSRPAGHDGDHEGLPF